MQPFIQPSCKFFSLITLSSTPFQTIPSLFSLNFSIPLTNFRNPNILSCSKTDVVHGFSNTQLHEKEDDVKIPNNDELELLNKPYPLPTEIDEETIKPDQDEVLAPFLKFFRPRESDSVGDNELGVEKSEVEVNGEGKKINVEYYEPKRGDFVVGVVVSGNENKLDVNIGADLLGTMLTKEILPFYDKEIEYLQCDLSENGEEFAVSGKMGIVKNDLLISKEPRPSSPLVDTGTLVFAEVLGRTLSGRPLLSCRRLFRRIAWHRVRQLRQLDQPIEVKITEWNTGGLLARIEGLRAFLPKPELVNRVSSFTELKQNIGRQIFVQITRINEDTNDLILSEREAWEKKHLMAGTLLEGTVAKIFPFGAQIKIAGNRRSGLLHISNITKGRVTSVNDLLKVDEKVKVLVVKSMFPEKIALSIVDLESEPGLFKTNKQKVYDEAEEMAKKYRLKKLTAVSSTDSSPEPTPPFNSLNFDDEPNLYANWKWFRFERDDK